MNIALIAGMTFLGALGGFWFKKVSRVTKPVQKLFRFLLGCVFYGLAAILNIIVLHHMPYTIVFPLTAITYVWTFLLSFFILGEKLNGYKLAGLGCILIGTFVLVH